MKKKTQKNNNNKTSKLRVTGLCAGGLLVTGEFPAQRASNAEIVSFDDVNMSWVFPPRTGIMNTRHWGMLVTGRFRRSTEISVHGGEPRCHDDVIKWKHFPRCWSFVRGIHRSPVISPHKGQWRGALMFSLICVRINGWGRWSETPSCPLWLHFNAARAVTDSFKMADAFAGERTSGTLAQTSAETLGISMTR